MEERRVEMGEEGRERGKKTVLDCRNNVVDSS